MGFIMTFSYLHLYFDHIKSISLLSHVLLPLVFQLAPFLLSYVCLYTHTCEHVWVCMYACMCVCVCMNGIHHTLKQMSQLLTVFKS